MNLNILAATQEDIETIRRIEQTAILTNASGWYSENEVDGWIAQLHAERYGAAIAASALFVACNEQDRRVIGFGIFSTESGYIEALCLAPQYDDEDLHRILVRECLQRARAARLSYVHVNATRDVTEFYEELAFDRISPSALLLADGTHIECVHMMRPVEHPFVVAQVKALKASIAYFGAGKGKQRTKERYVVEAFLRGLGHPFEPKSIKQPEHDPPDATLGTAAFEIKELYPRDRRRSDEYKDELARAMSAFWPNELLTPYAPRDIALDALVTEVIATAVRHAKKYTAADRTRLDLLIYANLRDVSGITPTPLPDLHALENSGWRSVSFVKGATSCVLIASDTAPDFLRKVRGRLVQGEYLD